jgi:hypothetical protein
MTDDDICGAETNDGGVCQNAPTDSGDLEGRCYIPTHNGDGDAENPQGRQPTVREHMDALREEFEKPISDRAAVAQGPIGWTTHKEWRNKEGEPYESYQEMYEDARAIAEERLVMDGLYADADSSLVKFLLKATHGYEDKKTVEHEGDREIEVDFNDVDT